MPKKPEAPSFAILTAAQKGLVRKLGCTEDHEIVSESGQPGKGWLSLMDAGWVRVFGDGHFGGYTVRFTLNGWERWCQQVDVEEGIEPSELEYE